MNAPPSVYVHLPSILSFLKSPSYTYPSAYVYMLLPSLSSVVLPVALEPRARPRRRTCTCLPARHSSRRPRTLPRSPGPSRLHRCFGPRASAAPPLLGLLLRPTLLHLPCACSFGGARAATREKSQREQGEAEKRRGAVRCHGSLHPKGRGGYTRGSWRRPLTPPRREGYADFTSTAPALPRGGLRYRSSVLRGRFPRARFTRKRKRDPHVRDPPR